MIKNLRKEAIIRRTDWSCDDNIQNGDETGIDSGGSVCTIFLDDAIREITLNRQFEIFPNPASSVITISSDLKEINQITIYNTQGVTIASIKIDKLKKYRIDINELNKGTYILEINNSERHNILVLD
ncbi:MAG: arylsulfatase B [Salibacteraceae bacterium]